MALSRAGMVSSEISAIAVRNFFMTHLLICPCNSTANGQVRCTHHGDRSWEWSDKLYFRIDRITKFDELLIPWFSSCSRLRNEPGGAEQPVAGHQSQAAHDREWSEPIDGGRNERLTTEGPRRLPADRNPAASGGNRAQAATAHPSGRPSRECKTAAFEATCRACKQKRSLAREFVSSRYPRMRSSTATRGPRWHSREPGR